MDGQVEPIPALRVIRTERKREYAIARIVPSFLAVAFEAETEANDFAEHPAALRFSFFCGKEKFSVKAGR